MDFEKSAKNGQKVKGLTLSPLYPCICCILVAVYVMVFKVRLHTTINRADFVSWCMLYTYEGNKTHS